MGWWQIDGPSGGVVWSNRDGDPSCGVLFNYSPGKAHSGRLYNGDEPADILDAALNTLADKLTDPAYLAEARYIFLGAKATPIFVDGDDKKLLHNARQKIIRVYKREWGRKPRDVELSAIFEFCTCFLRNSV